ncbi:hypothetical protein L249_3452, partial [Ophiocordyceps polyrhachis-furcata BCC 54312]
QPIFERKKSGGGGAGGKRPVRRGDERGGVWKKRQKGKGTACCYEKEEKKKRVSLTPGLDVFFSKVTSLGCVFVFNNVVVVAIGKRKRKRKKKKIYESLTHSLSPLLSSPLLSLLFHHLLTPHSSLLTPHPSRFLLPPSPSFIPHPTAIPSSPIASSSFFLFPSANINLETSHKSSDALRAPPLRLAVQPTSFVPLPTLVNRPLRQATDFLPTLVAHSPSFVLRPISTVTYSSFDPFTSTKARSDLGRQKTLVPVPLSVLVSMTTPTAGTRLSITRALGSGDIGGSKTTHESTRY